ncbi:uncharacterized protein SCHCODRAFT_02210928 [Schizophyllum commune H4-8]|uniref:uncharacterized protein n=1 Tax=Schizophyllum commune (strain H4-8 / FGSC 9210) TaxID=578458 RepID=UPI002160CF41|nr:uncharacterized protein SCHCODRAFT_02210928 [Schizophyllum commune H4-8]KAI5894510.1 hypothetical protein SCHCODRAFT_02210928 [Schizophyllum commune H4-8]
MNMVCLYIHSLVVVVPASFSLKGFLLYGSRLIHHVRLHPNAEGGGEDVSPFPAAVVVVEQRSQPYYLLVPDTMSEQQQLTSPPTSEDRRMDETMTDEGTSHMRQQTPPSPRSIPAGTTNDSDEKSSLPLSNDTNSLAGAQKPRELRSNAQAAYLLFQQDYLRSEQGSGDRKEGEDEGDNAAAAAWKHLPEEQRRAWEQKVEGSASDPPAEGAVDKDGDVQMGQETAAGDEQNNVASGEGQEGPGDADSNKRSTRSVEDPRYELLATLIAQGVPGEELGRRMAEWEAEHPQAQPPSAVASDPPPAPPTQTFYDSGYSRASIYPTSDSRTERGDPDGEHRQRPPSPGAPRADGPPSAYPPLRTRNYTGPEGGFVPAGAWNLANSYGPPPPGYTYYSPLTGGPPAPQAASAASPSNGASASATRKRTARGAAKQAKAKFAGMEDNDSDEDASDFEEPTQDGADGAQDQGSKAVPKPKAKGKRKSDGTTAAARKKQKKTDGGAEAPPVSEPAVMQDATAASASNTGPSEPMPSNEGDASTSSPSASGKKANPRVKNKWACDYCSATFTRKYDRQRHLDSQICKTRSGNAMAAASHLTSADALPQEPSTGSTVVPVPPPPSERDVERTCTKCGHIFARRDAYLRHKNSDFNCETWKGTKGRKGRGRPTKNGSMAPGQLAAAAEAAGITIEQGGQGGSPEAQSQQQQQQSPPEHGPPPVGQPLMFANPLMPQHMQMMMMPPGKLPMIDYAESLLMVRQVYNRLQVCL